MSSSKSFDEILKEIKIEFLYLADNNDGTYIISLEKALKWIDMEYEWIRYSTESDYRKNYNSRKLRGETLLLKENEDYEWRKYEGDPSIKRLPWFSVDGFKCFCMLQKTDKSYAVRKHFIEMEREYLKALKSREEENKQELLNLYSEFNDYKNSNNLLTCQNNQIAQQNLKYKQEILELRKITDFVKSRDAFACEGTPQYKMFSLVREKYMHKIELFTVNPTVLKSQSEKKQPVKKKQTKKDIELSSSDEENVELRNFEVIEPNIAYDEVDTYTISTYMDEELYFHLPVFKSKAKLDPAKYHHFGPIYVLDKDHLESLRIILESQYFTNMKNIYFISFQALEAILYEAGSDRLFDTAK